MQYTESMLSQKVKSLKYAMNGLHIAVQQEPNFRLQLALCAAAICLGLFFRISPFEWLLIITLSGLVFTAELFNTALEELCDMLNPTHDPHVAKIKDLSAAAVLAASVSALLVGIAVFLPRIVGL